MINLREKILIYRILRNKRILLKKNTCCSWWHTCRFLSRRYICSAHDRWIKWIKKECEKKNKFFHKFIELVGTINMTRMTAMRIWNKGNYVSSESSWSIKVSIFHSIYNTRWIHLPSIRSVINTIINHICWNCHCWKWRTRCRRERITCIAMSCNNIRSIWEHSGNPKRH